MNLQEATEQFADLVELGSQALQRLAEAQLAQPSTAEFLKSLNAIRDSVECLKTTAGVKPGL